MKQKQHKSIFFHVGLPKAASTFLQRNVFPNFNSIQFIKKHDFKHRDRIIENTSCHKILMSIELNLDAEGGMAKLRDVAAKYPHTYPIIVLRKHGSWLKSKYKYYLRKHGDQHFDDYFDLDGDGVLELDNLLFYPKLKLLESLFNHEPLVIFQEELKENPLATIDMLANFMDVTYKNQDIQIQHVKKSYSSRQLKAIRRFNRVYQYDHSSIRSKTLKFIYKKFSGLLLHSIAYISLAFPVRPAHKRPLIPQHAIHKVDDAFREDWDQCIHYAGRQRNLLFSAQNK